MPAIQASDFAYDYLRSRAEPFVDQPQDVLDKIIKENMAIAVVGSGGLHDGSFPLLDKPEAEMVLPDVTHTALLAAWVEGQPLKTRSWQHLLVDVISAAVAKAERAAVLKQLLLHHQDGHVNEPSHYHVPAANLTFLGSTANRILAQIARLSAAFDVTVEVEWRWYDNPKAQKPGANGSIHLP